MMNKVLPTIYNGVKYRSRTEARWARFFDAAGIRFVYEPEGFNLPSGWYLPDFAILYGGRVLYYAEVKFGMFSDTEKSKCRELCEVANTDVVMLSGPPDFKVFEIFQWAESKDCKKAGNCDLKDPFGLDSDESCGCQNCFIAQESEAILCTSGCKHFPFFWVPGFEDEDGYFKPGDWYEEHARCIYQAQDERFV